MTITRTRAPGVNEDDQALMLRIYGSTMQPSDVVVQIWRWVPAAEQWTLAHEKALDGSVPAGDNPQWDQSLQTLYNVAAALSAASCCPF